MPPVFGLSRILCGSFVKQITVDRHAGILGSPACYSLLLAAGMLATGFAAAQQTVTLPNTITSIAGSKPVASTVNATCPTNAQFTASDVLGDGCPAINATFSGNERSLTVDPLGNLYTVADTTNPQSVRRIDARTGNISVYAGAGSGNGCSGTGVSILGTTYTQTDKLGDGCPVSLSGGFNGARGLGSDPYGNIILPVAGDYIVHFICNAVSPLCTAAQARVGLMRNLAGCTLSTTGYGTSVAGTTVGTAGDGTNAIQTSGTCTTGTSQPRQAVGDRWENIYFTDNGNSRIRVVLGVASVGGIANPLYAAESLFTATNTALATPTQGFIYPIAGGGTACAAKTDAGGDGCPFFQTLVGSTTYVQGLAVTPEGDFLFADGLGRLRVIYLGGATVKTALAANGIPSPQPGYSYALIGNGTGTSGATGGTNLYYNSALSGTYLGSTASLQASAPQRLATDAVGNIYLGDQAQVLFYDIYTGYVRRLGGGTTAVSCNSNALGDGCPLAQSLFGAANSVLSVSLDNLGNLYLQDLNNKLIRRASAATLPSAAVGTSQTSGIVVHLPASGSVGVVAAPSPDFAASASCGSPNSDHSTDCTVPFVFAPTQVNLRNDPYTITTTLGSATTVINTFVGATATGTALVFDPSSAPATTVLGASTTGNTAVLTDGQGNSYVGGTQGISRINSSGIVKSVYAQSFSFFAVDAPGNVYTTNGTTGQLTKLTYSAANDNYTSAVLSLPTLPINGALTQAYVGPFVVDPNGTLYVADTRNLVVYRYNPNSGVAAQLTQTALTNPTVMTQDSYGYLLVVDGTSVLKIPPSGFPVTAASPVANPKVTFPTALTALTSIAVDQGENLYLANNGSIVVLSLSGSQYTLPGIAGSAAAVDGAGNLYTVASTVAGVTKVVRSAQSHDFGTDVSTPYIGVFLNTGASSATGFNQTDTGGNYAFLTPSAPLATGGPTCNLSSTALASGALCNTSIQFAPTATGSGATPDIITLLPAPGTVGALSLNGTKSGSTATTGTTIAGNTSGLVYSTGVETTFTVTVTQSTGTPAGSVSVVLDGGTAATYALTAASASTATASIPVSGLVAAAHTIVATYAGSPGIAGSTSTSTGFTIAPASTSVSWTPAATTQPFSAAIGTGVLNASASAGASAISGVFVYTATQAGGSPVNIHSASFLPIGSYALAVTFYPTDSVDYTSSIASVASYTITKASTSAAVGASQFTVASDGTGNFTTVQSAVNALGASGGSVYIRPGTYNGFVTVVQPNVALRGLGGDPTAVVLTRSAGAFSNSGGVYQYTGEFTAANSNGAQLPGGSSLFSGDEGSATLVVAKGVNTALGSSTLTPNGFLGENFTLNNTYDSDTATSTSTYVSGSNCVANAGPARTYNDLFNAGLLCASQALAIWTTSDLAVMNNVYSTSLQDTIYAGSQGAGSAGYVPARQYWFRGKVTGTVDYIFGDAAAVWDYSSIYTVPHGTGVAGTATIEAQNKATRTGSASDYLSGYVMNSNVFTSYTPGMNGLEFGRPYGTYSTYLMLNSYVDQVAPAGYIEFSGQTNLPTSTYAEYNDIPYTDPAPGSPDLNGVLYPGLGGNSGSGVTGTRETVSQNPGTPAANNTVRTSLTLQQAQAYFPANFLGQTVPATISSISNWNPTAALAAGANSFVPSGTSLTVAIGSSVTILMRPQTPGLGAIANGNYALPTGTYMLTDTLNGLTSTLASGSLDAAGEAYLTTSTLAPGAHSLSWTYSGDTNFSGSTTTSAYTVNITPGSTTTVLSQPGASIVYGNSQQVTVTVSGATGTPAGTVSLVIDGATMQTATLTGGSNTFTVSGLAGGAHSFTASYAAQGNFGASSTSSPLALTVTPAALTVTASCADRLFGTPATCAASVAGYRYNDTAATVFTGIPTGTSAATRQSSVGTYTAAPLPSSIVLTAAGAADYTLAQTGNTFQITGGAPQLILFAPLPNFMHGTSYQLTARTSSGLPVTYTLSVGSGIVSLNGSVLTVTGTGAVTIIANQSTDPSGDYAAASPVSRSFVAQ